MKRARFYISLVTMSLILSACNQEETGHKHKWGETTYSWYDDYTLCNATRVCLKDSTHIETETVESTYEVTTEAHCESDGVGLYTASFENKAFATQHHESVIPSTGHNWGTPTYSWSSDYSSCTATRVCLNDSSHVDSETVTSSFEETTGATCENSGVGVYTATFENFAFETQTYQTVISALGHDWDNPTYELIGNDQMKAKRVCKRNESHIQEETVSGEYSVITAPTATSEGEGLYTFTFTNDAFTTQYHHVTIGKLDFATVPKFSEDGKTVTYGLYPRTNVNDPDLKSALNELRNSTDPDGNGYYLYNGEYYYREGAQPYNDSCKFDNGTTISLYVGYWYKCEPITWNVLSVSGNEYLVVSSELLYARDYYPLTGQRNIDGKTVFASNYQHSSIREWLNDKFYQQAFYLGSSYIKTTHVDNSAKTTGSSSNPYICDDTEDKVFLLSYKDYTNSSYGFTNNSSRKCRTTDYARATGAYYSSNTYNGYYWTRSPTSGYMKQVMYFNGDGSELFNDYVTVYYRCARPAITLKITNA